MGTFNLTTQQLIFIIVVPLIVLIIAGLFVSYFIIRHNRKKNFKEYCYKKINEIVLANDYLLINNFPLGMIDGEERFIDHVLCGEKFIYIINDFYFDGDLSGNSSDPSFILFGNNEKKYYVDNPLKTNKKLLSIFSSVAGIDLPLLIGISLINDSCNFKIKNHSFQFFARHRHELTSFINEQEKRDDISKINQKLLEEKIKYLASKKKDKNEKQSQK